jgi:RimJ/RimL family protein N-acetyltransferase
MLLVTPAYTMDQEEQTHQLSHVKLTLPSFQQDTPWKVTLESKRLFMRSVLSEDDLKHYFKIFFDPITMHQYMDGNPKTPANIIGRHTKYWDCWKNGNPFSSYLIFLKAEEAQNFLTFLEESPQILVDDVFSDNSTRDINKSKILLADLRKEFTKTQQLYIGHILLEPIEVLASDADELMSSIPPETLPKSAELSYVLHHFFWNRQYGREALGSVIEAAAFFNKKGFKLNSHPIENLIATASERNIGSWKILEANRFQLKARGEVKDYDGERRLYLLNVQQEGTP